MLEAGDRTAGYEIEGLLGAQTETGVVYQARRARDGVPVTLKLVADHLSRDRRFRRRLDEEADIQAALKHPAIAPVLEVGTGREGLYVAMARVERPNLADLLLDEELEPSRALRFLEAAASGLDAAADAGLVHRDLRPGTIWIGRDERVLLADFGLGSAPASEREINTLEIAARAEYVSPEEVEGQATTRRSSVYSLAAILVECLTGRPPYPEESQVALLARHLYAAPPSVSQRRPSLPGELDGVVARALAKDPASRFGSCLAFVEAARGALDEAGPEELALPEVEEPEPAPVAPRASGGTATVLAPAPAPARTGVGGGAAAPPPRERSAPSRTTTRRRRRFGAILAGAVLLAASVGATSWVLATASDEPAPPPPAEPVRAGTASSAAVTVSYPGDWQRVERVAAIPGLALSDAVTIAPSDAPEDRGLLVGRMADAGPYLLPPPLVERLPAPPSLDDAVRLGRLEAFRHRGLAVEGYPQALTLYAMPTTSGVVGAACFAPADEAENFMPACERVASTVRLIDARPYPLAPDAAYGQRVSSIISELNRMRGARRDRFQRAVTPQGQADAARDLARGYDRAANAFAASPPERLPERRANEGIVAALRGAQGAYSALARAARTNDRAGFNSARAAVRRSEAGVERTLRGLETFGYTLL